MESQGVLNETFSTVSFLDRYLVPVLVLCLLDGENGEDACDGQPEGRVCGMLSGTNPSKCGERPRQDNRHAVDFTCDRSQTRNHPDFHPARRWVGSAVLV